MLRRIIWLLIYLNTGAMLASAVGAVFKWFMVKGKRG